MAKGVYPIILQRGSISDYIAKILMYRDQLAGSAHALSDADIISHFVTSLPESWNVIQSIIANQAIADMTLDSVILSLNNFEL